MLQMLFFTTKPPKKQVSLPESVPVCLDLLAAAFGVLAENSFPERRADSSMIFPVIQRAALSKQRFHFS